MVLVAHLSYRPTNTPPNKPYKHNMRRLAIPKLHTCAYGQLEKAATSQDGSINTPSLAEAHKPWQKQVAGNTSKWQHN